MKGCWPLAAIGGLVAACAVTPSEHLGPVTATATVGAQTFACSQAGIFEVGADGLRFVADPGWRPFALAGRRSVGGEPVWLLAGGGEPARHGRVQLLTAAGSVLADARIADDLVYAVAVSSPVARSPHAPLAPHKALAAAGCADGRVVLLMLPDLTAQSTSWRHDGPVVAVAFSPDGAQFASGGRDGKLLIGAAGVAEPTHAIVDHTAAVTCLAWSENGLLASGARDGKLRLHDRTGRLLRVWLRLGGPVRSVAFRGQHLDYEVSTRTGTVSRAGSVVLP
ncbi:MAG: WD40 repeat protein [Planctomycetota bacterium]|jgi:WD40 repeat protein